MSDMVRAWLDQARARAEAAGHHVGRLCTKEDRWTMSVPPRDDDSDILLTQVAEDAEAAVEALRAVLDLHKPLGNKYSQWCETCSESGAPYDALPYPCPTVQAISRAIKKGNPA